MRQLGWPHRTLRSRIRSIDINSGKPSHTVDGFWAERFLKSKDDLVSGPLQKPSSVNLMIGLASSSRNYKNFHDKNRSDKFVESGMQRYYFPYGGSLKMCPGRFFVKRQFLITVALMLRAFGMELVDPCTAAKTQSHKPPTLIGTVKPNSTVSFRVRKREPN